MALDPEKNFDPVTGDFRYVPQWQGPLSGRSFEQQTEEAINYLRGEIRGVSTPSDAPPLAPGTADPGTMNAYSRGDHVHPLQQNISGNAESANKLRTARMIELSGDVDGNGYFDGSTNIVIPTSAPTLVHKTGAETIAGAKTFASYPIIPSPGATDDSKKAVNSEWVRDLFASTGGFSFGPDGKVYVDFSQMDPAVMRAIVTAMILPGGGLASDIETGNLYVDFDEMDPDIMRQVVLSMVKPGSGLAVDESGQLYVDFDSMPPDQFEEMLASIHVPIWIGENGVGTEFYVDIENGIDTTADGRGKSESKPWRTIRYAAQQLTKNYNINTRTARINVNAGTYTETIPLSPYSRTTGSIVIRPWHGGDVINVVRTIGGTAGGFAINHTGGVWEIQDINLKLIANEQMAATALTGYIVTSQNTDETLTLTHCPMEFEDNSVVAGGGVGGVQLEMIYIPGGHVAVRNNAPDTSSASEYEVSWSGTQGNATDVTWIYLGSQGKFEYRRAGVGKPRGFAINVSGAFTTFCLCNGGSYQTSGGGPASTWVGVDSPTGKRFNAVNGGTIATGTATPAAAQTYFPGDVAGTFDASTYSWIAPSYDGNFSATPVYSVTLAEDTAAPYTFTLQNAVRKCVVAIFTPADTQNRNVSCFATLADGTTTQGCNVASVAGTSAGGGYWRFFLENGLFNVAMSRYNASTTGMALNAGPTLVFSPQNAGGITSFSCGKSDGTFLAGTQFVVYAAQEA